MYKIETHLHTAEVSRCARLSAAEMMRLYAGAGYHTVVVTDHCMQRYFDGCGEIPWEEKAALFFRGGEAAREAGEPLGLTVLTAAELSFKKAAPNDYLVYGFDRKFLTAHPDVFDWELSRFYETARARGMLVIQAHPNRDGRCRPTPEFVDGLEIYNSNPRHEDHSEMSERCAREHHLLWSAGSDAHRTEDVAGSGLLSETPVRTMEEFIALIRSGKQRMIRQEAPL